MVRLRVHSIRVSSTVILNVARSYAWNVWIFSRLDTRCIIGTGALKTPVGKSYRPQQSCVYIKYMAYKQSNMNNTNEMAHIGRE